MSPARILSFLAATALGLIGTLQTASAFEGQVDMQITNPQKKNEAMVMHYTLKGQKLRFDMPTQASHGHDKGSVALVVDNDTHQMLILMDSGDGHKMAMRRAMPDPKTLAASGNQAKGDKASNLSDVHPPTPTGRTETIAGYEAAEYKMTDKNGEEIDLWLAKGLGVFMGPGAVGGGFGRRSSGPAIPAEWQNFAATAGFFPLRMTTQDKSGKVTMKMEVVRIDKNSVSDSTFSSAGYEEMQMPSFGGLFGH